MTRTSVEGRQLVLLPVGDMGPPDDPVGVALGIGDDYGDPDQTWVIVMALFGRISVRAYLQAYIGSESPSQS